MREKEFSRMSTKVEDLIITDDYKIKVPEKYTTIADPIIPLFEI